MNLRVTSDIWVHVFLRREAARGAYATVISKGSTEAGAIYIVENTLAENFNLYGPAPQSLIKEGNDDRKFELIVSSSVESEIETNLTRQRKFDPDIWVIETECRDCPPSIDIVLR